jgi:hypothetical protein
MYKSKKYKRWISMDNKQDVLDNGPFFHGTKAELKIGDLLKPQHLSNYQEKNPTIYISLQH